MNEEMHNEEPGYGNLTYLFSSVFGSELAEMGRLHEALRELTSLGKSILMLNEALRQRPAAHRARRYAAQERRRRNEARRQMVAYQRRQQARGQA